MWRKAVVALAFALAIPCSVIAQQARFPDRTIKIVVPFPPGGSPDISARFLAEALTKKWNASFVVENVGGAAGAIGADQVARAEPDGYTWLAGPNNVLIFNPLMGTGKYDTLRDFAPVSNLISALNVVVVAEQLPIKSVAELIAHAKANPGTLNFGTAGPGSPQDLSGRLLMKLADITMVPVAYRGISPLLPDLMTNRVQLTINPAAPVLSLVNEGKLRLLAGTGQKRYHAFPDLPAVAETVPEYNVDIWTGIVLPARAPPSIVASINAGIVEVMTTVEMRERLKAVGLEPAPTTPQAFAALIREDLVRWRKVLDQPAAEK
ncbi:MAG: tripartite tricarboxylate transporter substrate binding protein [Devosia sp.]